MKKLLILVLASFSLFIISCSNESIVGADDGITETEPVAVYWPWKWGSLKSTTIDAQDTHTDSFTPNKTGKHAIKFKKEYWGTGNVKCYWRDGTGPWNRFTIVTLFNGYQTVPLTSGSASINYMFEFYNSSSIGTEIDIEWRFYTD